MKKKILEGLEIYELTNEFQIYVPNETGTKTMHRLWKCGDVSLDAERVGEVIANLIRN